MTKVCAVANYEVIGNIYENLELVSNEVDT